jgi:penicillin-binding protein 1C
MNIQEKVVLLRQRRERRTRARGGAGKIALQVGGVLVALIVLSVVLTILAGVGTTVGVYAYYAKDLPDPNEIVTRQETFETTKIYDRTGKVLLMEVIDPRRGDRTLLPLEQIPEALSNATIALEDKTFYSNIGIDPLGIARAFLQNLQGNRVQGGSSITVQLVKNILIPEEERYQLSYARKIKEAIMAMEISRLYSKGQILEWYLNTNYYGNWAIGVEAAAQVYFGKHAQELTLAECAMLAPIVQYPAMNPIDNPDEAKKRQGIALDRLVAEGYITQTEADGAFAEPLQIRTSMLKRYDIVAPHFAMYVRKQLEDRYGADLLYQGGLKVYTTVDLEIQRIAEEEARAQVARFQEEKKDVTNASVVVLRARTGEILAMVGSIDYWNEEIDGNVNVATADRQPGSSFKPFSYVTAFHQGHSAAEMVMDVHVCFDDYPNPPYCPENYDREYFGPESLRTALARSRNIPAVKVLDMVGVGNVIRTAHAMGINTLNQDLDYYGLSLTLGGGEVWLLDLTYAYSVFANGGVMTGQPTKLPRPGYRELDPVSILRVEDAKGRVLDEYRQPEARNIVLADGRELTPQEAYLLTNVLSDNNARAAVFGANSALRLSRPAAAKTGTTTDWRDVWTIGYTPQIVTGVWVGNNDNTPMVDVSSARAAAPIWHNVMERIYNEGFAAKVLGEIVDNFAQPPGMTRVEVGVQILDEDILRAVNRGHGLQAVIDGTAAAKHSGLKVCYHIMPGLPGSSPQKDLDSFRRMFEDPSFRPDMLKIYPTLVVQGTSLHEMWKSGKYVPYSTEEAVQVISEMKRMVPPWARIQRIQRDIPAPLIEAGVDKGHLRELIKKQMHADGHQCRCIRCREVGLKGVGDHSPQDVEMNELTYGASGGREVFISYDLPDQDALVGYARLRLEADGEARLRELKVFGRMAPFKKRAGEWQHRGYGKELVERAEQLAAEWGSPTLKVTSGIGVRGYYADLGYGRDGVYMTKRLKGG